MNQKMYLPLACLLFCVAFIVAADAPSINKLLMAGAAGVFAVLLFRAMRRGK
jgi:lipopolysaccharide export LptBFGC system permease protein LptF